MDPTARPRSGRVGRLYNPGNSAASDEDLIRELQLEASLQIHDGPVWRAIRDDIWRYSSRTLAKLIRTERVWAEYRRLGGIPATDLRFPAGEIDPDVAHDLADDTVVRALPVLRAQLLAGRWQPEGGASIRTWATNLMILRLPSEWRKWRRRRNDEAEANGFAGNEPRPHDQPHAVIYQLDFERLVELLDDDLQPILRLDCDGDTDAEIAVALGLTPKQVEYRLLKARRTIARRLSIETRTAQRTAG